MIGESVADWYSGVRALGNLFVFGIVGIPVYLAVGASLFGRPRNLRAAGVFVGTVAAFAVGFVLLFPILGAVLGIFVP